MGNLRAGGKSEDTNRDLPILSKAGLPTVTSSRQAHDHQRKGPPMAATQNLSQSHSPGKFPISKSGVLTIHGYGVRVRMQSGHLEIEDGIGPERRKLRLSRVGHGLKRLVCISEDGFVTLSALRWLADVGA